MVSTPLQDQNAELCSPGSSVPERRSSGAGGGGDKAAGGAKRKKRRRRQRKSNFKPYYKMTAEEKKVYLEKEKQRAEKKQAVIQARGASMAPYNTTQFLMDDLDARRDEMDEAAAVDEAGALLSQAARRNRTVSETLQLTANHHNSDIGSESGSWQSAPHARGPHGGAAGAGLADSSDSFEREFEMEYESVNSRRLENMTKEDLVREHIRLEDELQAARRTAETVQRDNARLRLSLALKRDVDGLSQCRRQQPAGGRAESPPRSA